tara:strand:+ start:1094 stop:1414 length:321 start_codon:yes stop_codon:yes gene_type:complete
MKNNTTYKVRLSNKYWFRTNHYKQLNIKYLGATDTKGSRIKITDTRLKESKTISFDYKFNSILEIVIDYFIENGYKNIISGFTSDEITGAYNLLINDFTFSLKNLK